MNKTSKRFLAVSIAASLAVVASMAGVSAQTAGPNGCCADRWDPAKAERNRWQQGEMGRGHRQRMQRHWAFMHEDVPSEYLAAINPVIATSANLKEGSALYHKRCAGCHGLDGMGDGEVGKSLSPSPALVAYLVQRPTAVDGYLLWSIAEGGARFGTDMPSFKEKMDPGHLWRIILFMRSGLPDLGG